jgi:ferredoxin
MKIIIDKNKCIGCFKCKKVCYSVFEVGPDGKAKVRYGVSNGDIEDAISAQINCPTGAITIIK